MNRSFLATRILPTATALVIGLLALIAGPDPARAENAKSFFAPGPVAPDSLPAAQIYPAGRTMLFAGYSGDPKRDMTHGFTVAGPFYGEQKQIDPLLAAGTPTLVQIGVPGHVSQDTAEYDLKKARAIITAQLDRWADSPHVACWAVQPEELRSWKKPEMDYLQLVTQMIRERDKRHRPIFLYQCNNRDAQVLTGIADHVDILGKGSYVNWCGYTDHRAWVRWSIEQSDEAFRLAHKEPYSLMMPELSADPAPEDVPQIRAWVRHDTYLGLMTGAKGVLIWSLHPRKEVKKTWQSWYDAYAEIGRELTTGQHLSDIFLFGERRHNLTVTPVESRPTYDLQEIANKEDVQAKRPTKKAPPIPLSPWTATEIAYGAATYLFLANSSQEPTHFRISGIPSGGGTVTTVFDGKPHPLPEAGGPFTLALAPWQIVALKISRP